MNVFTINKGFVFAAALIVMGVIGLVDSASASYNYKHHPRDNYKFDSYHNGHQSSSWHGNHNNGHKRKYYKKHHKYHYSRKHRSYNKGYVKNHSYGYHNGSSYSYNKKHYYHENRRRQHRNHQGYNSHRQYYNPKVSSHCYNYKVTTHGGRGGFRFQHDKSGFKHIDNSSYVNKICGYDSVEFELSKLDPVVSVSIEINGRYFNYPSHSGHDRYVNNWHRKYFSVNFKRY